MFFCRSFRSIHNGTTTCRRCESYDENTFRPQFANSVGSKPLPANQQQEINAAFAKAAKSFGLTLKLRDNGTDWNERRKQVCLQLPACNEKELPATWRVGARSQAAALMPDEMVLNREAFMCACERACYDCLKSYGNQSQHEKLSRESVIDFFR